MLLIEEVRNKPELHFGLKAKGQRHAVRMVVLEREIDPRIGAVSPAPHG